MRIPGANRIRRGVNRLLNQVRGRAAILLYHRIADFVPDPQLLCVSPAHFEAHLAHIRERYNVMDLASLPSAMREGRIPERTVVVTLDDGYVDNVRNARALLERFECPATVFVVAGYVGSNRELLSDELERIVLQSPELPARLSLELQGRVHHWELGAEGPQDNAWNILEKRDPTRRHSCYRDLHKLFRPLGHAERERGLQAILRWSGNDPVGRADRRIMRAAELRELIEGGLIEVGAHTVHHVALGYQTVIEQREDIESSRTMLVNALGHSVSTFAYPYGDPLSIGDEAPRMVRDSGFSVACANSPGLVNRNSSSFLLPRFLVRNWPPGEFEEKLKGFFAY